MLTPNECEELFHIIERFRKSGNSVIFISHKLKEVMRISDRVTVLRNGNVIDTVETSKTNANELAYMMVGRKLDSTLERVKQPRGDVVLEVRDLTMKSMTGAIAVNGLSLTVHAGEIYGIAGVDGNGQSELIKGITALMPRVSGEVCIEGKKLTGSCRPRDVLSCNVAHIPEDRQKIGTTMNMNVAENLLLHCIGRTEFRRGGFLRWKKLYGYSDYMIDKYSIKTMGSRVPLSSLSGGNQQKLLVGRELEQAPRLLIAVHPTRGVDIGAIDFIHKQIIAARNEGCAVLLVSTELDEILTLSDRISVIFKGQIKGELARDEVKMSKIALWMAGHDDEAELEGEATTA